MQVCAEADVTNEEILNVCNEKNPSGTSQGWCEVLRKDYKRESMRPVKCASFPDRTHFLIQC